MEDQDSCTTEILLNPDNSVTILATNGPQFVSACGSWEKRADEIFLMELTREYEAGKESKKPSDMGPFTFSTIRVFEGNMSKIGAKLGMEGSLLDGIDMEKKLGYFEMIETTVGEDGEESLNFNSSTIS